MCFVMYAVEGKIKRVIQIFFLADSDFMTESFRFSFSGEWQVCSCTVTAEELSLDNFMLHVDGASRDQCKFIGHQVTLANSEILSLGFLVLPQKIITLLDVTIGILQELSNLLMLMRVTSFSKISSPS